MIVRNSSVVNFRITDLRIQCRRRAVEELEVAGRKIPGHADRVVFNE